MSAGGEGRLLPAVSLLGALAISACGGDGGDARVPAVTDGGRSTLLLAAPPTGMAAFDAEARYGTFVQRDGCILLDVDGRSHAPVFATANVRDAAFRLARQEARAGGRVELRGGPIARVTTADGTSRSSSCNASLFLVDGFQAAGDARPQDPPPPVARD